MVLRSGLCLDQGKALLMFTLKKKQSRCHDVIMSSQIDFSNNSHHLKCQNLFFYVLPDLEPASNEEGEDKITMS